MKPFAFFAAAGLAVALIGTAHAADTTYSASLALPGTLPMFRTGVPSQDGPHNIAGDWLDRGERHAGAYVRNQTGPGPTWDSGNGNSDMHNSSGPSYYMMGETRGQAYLLDNNASASGSVYVNRLGASGTVVTPGAEINAYANYQRSFSLDAFSSFTFSAIASLSILGDAEPLDTQSFFTLDPSASFASLTATDALGRLSATLSATLNGLAGGFASAISYAIGSDGLLSLTISNQTANAITGTLGLATRVGVTSLADGSPVLSLPVGTPVAAPVPEPAAMVSMLLGLGLVAGAVGRRRQARRAP